MTTGVVGQLLCAAEDPPGDLLERLAQGALTVAVPAMDPVRVQPRFSPGPELSGTVRAFGADVDLLALPLVRDGQPRIVLVPTGHPGVSGQAVPPLDPSRPIVDWRLHEVPVTETRVVAVDDLTARWRALLGLVCALDAVGAARTALDRTVAYAKAREQFGRPIGSFQAYKHRCATALVELKLGQALAFRAAEGLAGGDRRLPLAAGITATRSALHVCGEAVQLHGALGFTWEAGVHRLLKRAKTAQLLADTPAAQRQLLCL
jgi:alkylation response protein AidB-like acyl-CoA dehydrogenase